MAKSMVYERDVLIPTRTGSSLRANVYRPVAEGQYPVIATLGPYGKDRNWADRNQAQARDLGGGPFVNWETPDPDTWVPKGYARRTRRRLWDRSLARLSGAIFERRCRELL